jgi:hypothetical protein
MKLKGIIVFGIIILLAAGVVIYKSRSFYKLLPEPAVELPLEAIQEKSTMKLVSPAFKPNQKIPTQYTCDGENLSPPLEISGVPGKAKSLALIMDDPDAPGGAWIHWVVWNIDPKLAEIPENSLPQGALEGVTSFGSLGYGGPCPPSGVHRYFFRVFALDAALELEPSASKTDLERIMAGHILEKAELMGIYSRQ